MQNGIEFSSEATVNAEGGTEYNNYVLGTEVEYSEAGYPIGMKYVPKLIVTDRQYNSMEEFKAGIEGETNSLEISLNQLMQDNQAEYQRELSSIVQGKKSNK
jgi:hypothetical protein